MTDHPEIFEFDDLDAQANALADEIECTLENLLLLPGGSSPKKLIECLKTKNLNCTISTSDERCVPLTSENSNFKPLDEAFGDQAIPMWDDENNQIKTAYKALNFKTAITLIGMGMDAHIASLFPGHPMNDGEKDIVNGTAPVEPYERVSLSLKALISSKRLILLINSSEKATLLKQILEGEHKDTPLAHLIRKAGSKLHIYSLKEPS